MSTAKEDFKYYFKATHLALKWIGIVISQAEPKSFWEQVKQTWWFYFMTIWLYYDVFGEIYWFIEGIQLKKSFSELTFIAPCIVFGVISTIKVVAILNNRFTAKNVLTSLETLFSEQEIMSILPDSNPKNQNILKNCRKNMKKLVSLLFWPNLGNVLLFIFFPLCVSLNIYLRTGEWVYVLPFTIKYPFDPYNIKVWPWVYIHQFISCVAVVLNVFGSDTLYCLFCIQIHMQFNLLKVGYQNFMKNAHNLNDDEIYTKLLVVVKKHQVLIDLVNQIEKVFSVSNLFTYACSSFLICLSGFNATTNRELNVIVPFTVFLISNLAEIFLLCYFGDMVMKSSSDVAIGVYSSNWYTAPVKVQKALLFVLARSQKPCTLTAARYVPIDLSTFSKIISTAWSYFALLKTIYTPSTTSSE